MNPFTYVIVGIIAFVVIGGIVIVLRDKQRAKAMRQLAESMNFSFDAEGDEALVSSFTRLPLFSEGNSKYAWNVMRGRVNDIDVTIMDHEYYTGSSKPKRHIQTVIQFQSSLLRLPTFTLRPQHLLHNIAVGFGFPDINFDSHPSFSKRYLLHGAKEDSVREVFGDEVLEFYERRAQWGTAGDGDRFLFCKTSKRIPPKDIRPFMEEGLVLFSLFKAKSGKAS